MSEEDSPHTSGPRPAYKDNPIWIEAISVTRAAYDLAEKVRPEDPLTARHLRRASVTIPAHLAGALSADDDGDARRDHVTTALGALAEVTRQAERVGVGEREAAVDLARRARELERAVSFQLGDAGTRLLMTSERARPLLYGVIAAAIVIAVAAFWLPRWWENREYRRAEKIAGIGSPVLPGKAEDARRKVDPGLAAAKVTEAVGKPSFQVRTEGASSHEIWKYYFADGTMTVNLTDGYVARISMEFGPPKIRQSRRP